MTRLQIAEIPFENGNIRYRYSRKLSDDGTKWIRDGLFQAYHENGSLASEGLYSDDVESGSWCDYHDNGALAAEGTYIDGVEAADWQFWDRNGIVSNRA